MAIFNIFNIGTGHTQTEPNNTMKRLYDDCRGTAKFINDGPTGSNALRGNLTPRAERTMAALKSRIKDRNLPPIDRINMTGHSRGAVLCHMLAHSIFQDADTRHLQINIMVIDPVHQSKYENEGAEGFDQNPNLRAYHAIIMENENSAMALGLGNMYPFKFVDMSEDMRKRTYYINMPGTHGSGTQALTNPIGKVVIELVKVFLAFRGTVFGTPVKQPLEMCELFAGIHLENPLDVTTGKRLIFNDGGEVVVHDPKNQKEHGIERRQEALDTADARNREFRKRRIHLPMIGDLPFFFNQKHAYYFKAAYPNLFRGLADPGKSIAREDYDSDLRRMGGYPHTFQTWRDFQMDDRLQIKA